MSRKRLILVLQIAVPVLAIASGLLFTIFDDWRVDRSIVGLYSPVAPVAADIASETTTTAPTSNRPKGPRKVFIVGDSAIAGLRWIPSSQVALQGFKLTLDLESCRRLVHHNCKSREGRDVTNALDTILNRAYGEADTLVLGVGYNDKSSNFVNDFDLIVNAARSRGFSQIIWLTYRETSRYILPGVDYTSDYASMNQILRDKIASGVFSDVVIADLWTYTSTAPQWFTLDGVHYKVAGAFGVADFLSRTIAALDGLACPQPWGFGRSVDMPCVRPESVVAARGQADLSSLYGV